MFLLGTLIATFGSMDPLPLGRGCDPRGDHHLVNGVPTLGNDNLQVQVGQARNHTSLSSSAVRVHGIAARAWTPTGCEHAVRGDRVNLRLIPFAVKRFLG